MKVTTYHIDTALGKISEIPIKNVVRFDLGYDYVDVRLEKTQDNKYYVKISTTEGMVISPRSSSIIEVKPVFI